MSYCFFSEYVCSVGDVAVVASGDYFGFRFCWFGIKFIFDEVAAGFGYISHFVVLVSEFVGKGVLILHFEL